MQKKRGGEFGAAWTEPPPLFFRFSLSGFTFSRPSSSWPPPFTSPPTNGTPPFSPTRAAAGMGKRNKLLKMIIKHETCVKESQKWLLNAAPETLWSSGQSNIKENMKTARRFIDPLSPVFIHMRTSLRGFFFIILTFSASRIAD